MIRKLSIIGLGLMGGSLGLAARKRQAAKAVVGYARRPETRRAALVRGVVDAVCATPAEAVCDADVVVLCLPILAITDLLGQCADVLADDSVVTDVGSTKQDVMSCIAEAFGDRVAFVGSHPIAGSEQTGLEAARADLYENAVTVLTPAAGVSDVVTSRVAGLWQSVGSRTVEMEAARHDALLARTSHMPHLLASLLVDTVAREGLASVRDLCGSGFKDATRIAAGSDAIWHDIIKTNARAIGSELAVYRDRLDRLMALLASGDFEGVRSWLAANAASRRELDGRAR